MDAGFGKDTSPPMAMAKRVAMENTHAPIASPVISLLVRCRIAACSKSIIAAVCANAAIRDILNLSPHERIHYEA